MGGLWNHNWFSLLVSLKFVTLYEGYSLRQVNEWVVPVQFLICTLL